MSTPRFPLLGKALALLAVSMGLLIALESVSGVVREREGRLREAEAAVADSLASQQTLMGPAVQRVCEESWESVQGSGAERRTVSEQRRITVRAAPAQLTVNASTVNELRHRGLFKVNGYAANTRLQARWAPLGAMQPSPEHAGGVVRCGAPELFVALSDVRGIRVARISLSGQELAVQPGSGYVGQPGGFHAVLPDGVLGQEPLQAEVALDLLGTASLALAPIGERTEVQLQSDWPHPSFGGRFLPARHEVSETGFSAHWQLSALATSAAAQLEAGAGACRLHQASAAEIGDKGSCVETFGVSFFDPVSPYVMSDRATKYGLLFIVLTFVGVGLVEVLRRLRVHPIQYLLVGSAIALFFLLLVSLSEHLAFGLAYALAAAACTSLLGFYGRFVLHSRVGGLAFGAAIGGLYGALYLLLRLEQSALVLGAIGMFVVLAAVMAATRHINWYALMQQMRSSSPEPAGASVPAEPWAK